MFFISKLTKPAITSYNVLKLPGFPKFGLRYNGNDSP